MRTDKDLRRLAKDIYGGQVFITTDPDEIKLCFMVFMFMDEEQLKKYEDVGSVYEYMSEAGPRSINGMPIFFSANILTMEETKIVSNYVKELTVLMKEFE